MELKQRFNLKTIFVAVVWLVLTIYVVIGLQPAEAARSTMDDALSIPSIGLVSEVVTSEAHEGQLDVPNTIVGSYSKYQNKTLLIGHSTTVFKNLSGVKLRDEIFYNSKTYTVVQIQTLRKADIKMNKIVSGASRDTIVLMTCAGTLLPGGDATQRLIITAVTNEV